MMRVEKKWKMKKRKKYTRMPFSEESDLYRSTGNEASEVTLGQSDTLAFPHIYLIIHTKWGNPISSNFVSPHTTLGQSSFIRTLITLFLRPYQAKPSFTQISSFPFVHVNWGNCKAYFPSWKVFYTTIIFFLTRLFIPSKLKAHITSLTHRN